MRSSFLMSSLSTGHWSISYLGVSTALNHLIWLTVYWLMSSKLWVCVCVFVYVKVSVFIDLWLNDSFVPSPQWCNYRPQVNTQLSTHFPSLLLFLFLCQFIFCSFFLSWYVQITDFFLHFISHHIKSVHCINYAEINIEFHF